MPFVFLASGRERCIRWLHCRRTLSSTAVGTGWHMALFSLKIGSNFKDSSRGLKIGSLHLFIAAASNGLLTVGVTISVRAINHRLQFCWHYSFSISLACCSDILDAHSRSTAMFATRACRCPMHDGAAVLSSNTLSSLASSAASKRRSAPPRSPRCRLFIGQPLGPKLNVILIHWAKNSSSRFLATCLYSKFVKILVDEDILRAITWFLAWSGG
ncbi:hypothetical protein AAHA92_22092 [Salvia divinorum]|uniref:Uncharacterized protein n=1 Tax=Salvia divinorum TaxID=28513 RepID=A0ABD1GMJ3_SALDI